MSEKYPLRRRLIEWGNIFAADTWSAGTLCWWCLIDDLLNWLIYKLQGWCRHGRNVLDQYLGQVQMLVETRSKMADCMCWSFRFDTFQGHRGLSWKSCAHLISKLRLKSTWSIHGQCIMEENKLFIFSSACQLSLSNSYSSGVRVSVYLCKSGAFLSEKG
jgi:hypothetical protein